MNRALFSKAFLLPVATAWAGLMLLVPAALRIVAVADGPRLAVPLGILAAATLVEAFLGCFLHEKIARCTSSWFERALRFGSFAFLLAAGPLLVVAFGLWGAWPTALCLMLGLAASIGAFAVPVHLLYVLDPKAGAPYFSMAQKFQKSAND